MKNLFIILLSIFSTTCFSQVKIENFNSPILKGQRELSVYLPPSYEKNPNKKYPLLILLDGDYLLDPFLSTIRYSSAWDDLPEVIVVGIHQNKDNARLTDCGVDAFSGMPDGKSVEFFDFLALELVPYIQSEFRTTPFKIIAGHDVTAAFLNFFLYQKKSQFNAYISMSPELPVGMENQIPEILSNLKQPIFYYLSSANGDLKNMQEKISQMDTSIKKIKDPQLNYKYEYFPEATHYSLVLHSIPSAFYQIFNATQPISTLEYDEKIVTLNGGYVNYLIKKYEVIENSFGIKAPIRINDFKAIETAILKNKDYSELDGLAILADKYYPKSMLSDYELAMMFELKGDNPRAVRYYMVAFNKEEIADLTKDMMFAKAQELKKTFAKKPKIKGKPGQSTEKQSQVEETPVEEAPPAEETPPAEEPKQ
jgi:predicted alpha/beta superfamily hydrolase